MFRTALLATAATALLAAPAIAAPAIALVGGNQLVMFDTESLEVSGTTDVTGVDSLVGIDLRPSNNTLVGVSPDNVVYTIDPSTGEATQLSEMNTPLPMEEGAAVIVDFNPMADRLRYMSGTTNHRVNVDTGEVTVDGSLAFEERDMHAGETPDIVAAAYINSYGQPESTAMYDIDNTIDALIQQTSPNDGTLAAIGKLGITANAYAMDVGTTEDGTNTAYLMANGTLYTVDIETGTATEVGAVEVDGDVSDITIMPAM